MASRTVIPRLRLAPLARPTPSPLLLPGTFLRSHPIASTSRTHATTSSSPSYPSSAYDRDHSSSSTSQRLTDDVATTTTPSDLTPRQRKLLERVIRVDQAGELGANWIYRGQLDVARRRADEREMSLIQHMWDQEKKHIRVFDQIVAQHRVRPTIMYPLWKAAAYTLGASTALMGKEAAMACTEAVETVIGEHYNDQLKELAAAFPGLASRASTSSDSASSDAVANASSDTSSSAASAVHPSVPLLADIIREFRDDELEHLDTAIENDAQKAPAHALLSSIIAGGCRGAIWISERI